MGSAGGGRDRARASEVSPEGGTVTPVSQWRVGGKVSLSFARLLARLERLVKERTVEVFREAEQRRSSKSRR